MGLAASSQPLPHAPPALYHPRNVRATPLYQLLESYYEQVKALWEDRFEKKFGFWRGFVDQVVARYLDCGVAEAGFARIQCDTCGAEQLLTLSCKQRGLCPSCDAKRATKTLDPASFVSLRPLALSKSRTPTLTALSREAFGIPTDCGFPFPTSTPTPPKSCSATKLCTSSSVKDF